MAEESTLLIIKPDAVRRGLAGEILSRIERKGLRIEAMRTMRVDQALAERHYAEHADKPFFEELVGFIRRRHRGEGHRAGGHLGPPWADGRDGPGKGRAGHDPRRLRHRDHGEPGPRKRLSGVGRSGDGPVLPALISGRGGAQPSRYGNRNEANMASAVGRSAAYCSRSAE